MMNQSITIYPCRSYCKKVGEFYVVRYFSPFTGKLTRVSVQKSGKLKSKVEAEEWATMHLGTVIKEEEKRIAKQGWRSNAAIAKHFEQYSAIRIASRPRSGREEMCWIRNYVLPYFVTQRKMFDPNRWYELHEDYLKWLQYDAKTKAAKPLALSSANKVITALNQFQKWMRRKQIIRYQNFRPFEPFDRNLLNRRTSKHLVSDDVFKKVHAYLIKHGKTRVYADLWFIQRKMGFRCNEAVGLAFHWLSDECPKFISEEFEKGGLEVLGSIYLESQPAKSYITKDRSNLPRVPLKGRREISVDNARTVPIIGNELWDMLVDRYNVQRALWNKKVHGHSMESYLLFDGANRVTYLELIDKAYRSMNLESDGTHVLRHTLSTEWTALKISEKVAELVLGHKRAAHAAYVHIVGQVNRERIHNATLKPFRKSGREKANS